MATEKPVVAVVEKKHRELNENRFQLREFKQEVYAVFVEAGTTIEDCLERTFWANVSARMRAPAKICVTEETKAWYAEFIVFVTANNWAEVRLFGEPIIIDRISKLPAAEQEYVIEDGGLQLLWIVKRVKDGRVVKGDGTLKNREMAEAWVRDYIKAQSLKAA